MNLQVSGARPPSARRPASRINPITGEETVTTARNSFGNTPRAPRPSSGSRPDDVPALNLGGLQDKKEKVGPPIELDPYKYKLDTPNTGTTVSWGTPTSTARKESSRPLNERTYRQTSRAVGAKQSARQSSRQTNRQPPKPRTAWDQPAVPENLPPPPDKYKKQYERYSEDMRFSYRQHSTRLQPTEAQVAATMAELKLDLTAGSGSYQDEETEIMERLWTTQPYSKKQNLRKMDREELENEKKLFKLMETVMVDQLSRAVVSNPEQNDILSHRRGSARPGVKRGSVRTLHDSNVSAGATENLLSKRVRFGARILSRNGRDALRELMGFYFAIDKSLTIYEYKKFGKSHKAMPFIHRGCYCHIGGLNDEKPYGLQHIYAGSNLVFETDGQPLPDSIQAHERVIIRVTDVDEGDKRKIMLEKVPPGEHEFQWKKMHLPETKEDAQKLLLMADMHACAKRQLKKRGSKTLLGLARLFRDSDRQQDGQINRVELEKALLDFHVDIPQEHLDDIWELLDTDGSGYLDYGEFMRGVIGEMSEGRKALVRKAFMKIDPTKRGYITVSDIGKFYCAYKHPSVISRESSESQVMSSFVETLGYRVGSEAEISWTEFELYYEGLSLGIDDDTDFENILKNSWSI